MSSNAERIFEQYMNGDWGKPKDKIRLRGQDILSEGTPIGYIHEYEDEYEFTQRIVILTLQDFKRHSSWKTHRKQLAMAANKVGFPVIFVTQLDMGFGLMYDITEDTIPAQLVKIAKYSQDEDIKTACCVTLYYDDLSTDKPSKLFSYNQLIDGEYMHAEEVVLKYIESLGIEKIRTIYSMLEPCYNCLQKAVDFKPQYIVYFQNHKVKWDTWGYIQLSNDLFAGQYKTEVNGRQYKIQYSKLHDKLIEKFYKEK
jgi:deoxycytidylate deaminase